MDCNLKLISGARISNTVYISRNVYLKKEKGYILCEMWQYIDQSTITTSRHRRDMTSDVSNDVKPIQTNK